MSTHTPTEIAFLQLAAAKGDLFSAVSAGQRYLIHNIEFHNTNSTAEVVDLYKHDGTNEYRLYRMSLAANETVKLEYPGEGLVVEASGKLTGNADTGAVVTCSIYGSVRAN